jgi:uncharacterized membrane protein
MTRGAAPDPAARLRVTGEAPDVGLLAAVAAAPGTFARSLAPRRALDQGLVTGLATGLHYLLSAATQELIAAIAGSVGSGSSERSGGRLAIAAVDVAAVPVGLAVVRSLPPRPGELAARGAVWQAGWRLATTGLAGALLLGAEAGLSALDERIGARGRLAAVPPAVPLGLGLSYVVERRRRRGSRTAPTEDGGPLSAVPSLAVAAGVVGGVAGAAYGEHLVVRAVGRGMSAVLPGPPALWRLAGHGAVLAGFASGVTVLWHRFVQRLEAGTTEDVPVIEPGEATHWLSPLVSGGPGSLVPWSTLGREGRRHALTYVRGRALAERPPGVPDLSIETVTGRAAVAEPVQVYVGLDSAPTARDRVELALAELDRTGGFDRSLLMLVSPTGTGYVNYVAVAAVQYLTGGDVATVTLQYSKRPSPLSLGMVAEAREQNRLLWLRVLERLRQRTGSRPRVVLFGESLGAHTSQDVFLHWGTLGLDAIGIDRALWIGTPYGSKWMHQVTGGHRLDVDRDAVAVINDAGLLDGLGPERRSRLRYVLLSHDNDGVTRFGLDLLWTPPRWLGPDRPRMEAVDGASPRGIPPDLRWRPITTFFQTFVDMKNAQTPGPYRAWAHEYRADLPRVVSEVYGLPASREELDRIDVALRRRETERERLFAEATVPAG